MKNSSKRYREITKAKIKDKKIAVKEILDLVKKIAQLSSTSQLMLH